MFLCARGMVFRFMGDNIWGFDWDDYLWISKRRRLVFQAPFESFWAHQFGELGRFPGPKLTNLHRQPNLST